MRTGFVLLVTAIGVMVVFFAVRRGAAEDAHTSPVTPVMPRSELATVPLKCEVESPAQVSVGAPLLVTVRLTNTGPEALSFYSLATPVTPGWHPFAVKHSDGEHVRAKWDKAYVTWPAPDASFYRRVEAGETVEARVDVSAQWTLRPGRIRIQQNTLADVFTGDFDQERAIRHRQPALLDCPEVEVEVLPGSSSDGGGAGG